MFLGGGSNVQWNGSEAHIDPDATEKHSLRTFPVAWVQGEKRIT